MVKNNKKISAHVRNRLRIIAPITIFVFIVCTISIFSYVYKIDDLQKQKNRLTLELEQLQLEEKELSSEINKLKDPDYIAKYARENYYYTKDGEYVIKIEKEEETKTSTEVKDNRSYYILFAGGIILIILLLFIRSLFKKRK